MAQAQEGRVAKGVSAPQKEESKIAYSHQPKSGQEPNIKRMSSRHSSVASGDGKDMPDSTRYNRQQPIGDAVSNAFDEAQVEDYSPDLIAKITQNVIQELKKASAETKSDFPQIHPTAPLAPLSPPLTQSGASPPTSRNIFTPPSPQKHGEYPLQSETLDSKSFQSRNGPASPTQKELEKNRSLSRQSSHSDGNNSGSPVTSVRPTTADETTLERIWGPLFDSQGSPTKRLGQFLRGIAVHMIECYEPKDSLVVTPEKMERFYEDTRLEKEAYPWSRIFDDEDSLISRMYRELEVQHHLVQETDHYDEKPDIPGLTPYGFEQWATMMIQAHPEEEFQRLQKATCALPINNPDDRKERFPKDISKRLFPTASNLKTRDRLVHAIEQHCHLKLGKSSPHERSSAAPGLASSPPRSEASYQSEPVYGSSSIERERNPYTSNPNSCIIDDLSQPASQPIERERKPYRAAPGQGRIYQDENQTQSESQPPPRSRVQPESRSTLPPPPPGPPPAGQPSAHRNGSVSQSQSRPINIPPPPAAPPLDTRRSEHVPESYHAGMNHRPSISTRRRNASPPMDWALRSEPDVRTTAFPNAGYDDYEDDEREYRRTSPSRRLERAETIDARDMREKRRSMYEPGEEYVRTRSNTTGQRNW